MTRYRALPSDRPPNLPDFVIAYPKSGYSIDGNPHKLNQRFSIPEPDWKACRVPVDV
jgi:hypothetical protein